MSDARMSASVPNDEFEQMPDGGFACRRHGVRLVELDAATYDEPLARVAVCPVCSGSAEQIRGAIEDAL